MFYQIPFTLSSENVALSRFVEGLAFQNERLVCMAADLEKVFQIGDKTLLSVKECADLLDVSVATMRKIAVDHLRIIKLSQGKVAAHKISAADLKRYVSGLLGI